MINFHIRHSFKSLQLMILTFSNLKTNLKWCQWKWQSQDLRKFSLPLKKWAHLQSYQINFFTALKINQNLQQSREYSLFKKTQMAESW